MLFDKNGHYPGWRTPADTSLARFVSLFAPQCLALLCLALLCFDFPCFAERALASAAAISAALFFLPPPPFALAFAAMMAAISLGSFGLSSPAASGSSDVSSFFFFPRPFILAAFLLHCVFFLSFLFLPILPPGTSCIFVLLLPYTLWCCVVFCSRVFCEVAF